MLAEKGVDFEAIEVRETPPSVAELKQMLKAKGEMKFLFNTSGVDYRSLGLKDKLPTLSEDEAFELLTENGNLVKRPFVVGDDICLVGFKLAEWEQAFGW